MMTSATIRNTFLDFFRSKGHEIVPSASIVIKNDPTLKFTNAGMNQFKEFFLGNRVPPYRRVADTQKCLRVSGKHNDLEEVGVDTYHHTMFEMLGNWSFGDYFKKEAIGWAWELLTEVYRIPKDKIYVTVFQGDAGENLPMDEEAFGYWKSHISEDRILMGNKKDNFWEMGDTGPCGPCSELHIDCRTDAERAAVDGKTLVNADHPQVIEIWNIVFMQFNRLKDGSLEPLPARHVDTGMGFERLVRVLQGKQSNYDTDIFTGTIAATEAITGKSYANGDDKASVAFRVIADHIRAVGFAIADGQLPSNTEAGYVIRRILRRAVRYYYSYLDYKHPLLFKLIGGLADQFSEVFPELKAKIELVTRVIKEEEESFLTALERGLIIFNELVKPNEDNVLPTKKILDGVSAFILNDTYGFPIDLTQLIAKEIGWEVDMEGFRYELQKQKDRSRAATAIDAEDWVLLHDNSMNEFVGYDHREAKTRVNQYRRVKSKGKDNYQVVLQRTPFYAESGGQVGDTGILNIAGEEIKVIDTKKENGLIIHFVERLPDLIVSGVTAKINFDRRKAIAAHHTATHLLQGALRQILGKHIEQKGSLVNDEYLRFDFSHFSAVTPEELRVIEKIVNEKIRENIEVVIEELPKEEALKKGAMALFGEKYGEIVRVVTIDPRFSVEFCGGTHVGRTGELGFFLITSETAVSSGVRRIEAKVANSAFEYIQNDLIKPLEESKMILSKKYSEIPESISILKKEKEDLRKKLDKLEAKQLADLSKELSLKVQLVGDIKFVGEIVEVGSVDALKKVCYDLKPILHQSYVVVLAANIEGKAGVVVMIDEPLVVAKGLEAPKLIKDRIAPLIIGGGGGQKSLATAGGQDTSRLSEVIKAIRSVIN